MSNRLSPSSVSKVTGGAFFGDEGDAAARGCGGVRVIELRISFSQIVVKYLVGDVVLEWVCMLARPRRKVCE